MIRANGFVRELTRAGFGLFTGVPCSMFKPLMEAVIHSPDLRYIGAVNEGDAVAIASGAELGGMRSVVLFQNSGLGNAVNPLTSLASTFKIPILILASWRGNPAETPDEPQHRLMGESMTGFFDLMNIPWELMPETEAEVPAVVQRAITHMELHGTPYALIVKKDSFESIQAQKSIFIERYPECRVSTNSRRLSLTRFDQDEVLKAIQDGSDEKDIIITTTGYTGRALYALDDRPNQLYMVGSMGCAPGLGLGLALARPQQRVIVIDGDGALLMRMGTLATIGYLQPKNFVHILLDNATYDSTGSQLTVSPYVDFTCVAHACGYGQTWRILNMTELELTLRDNQPKLKFIHVKTKPREHRKLPRPVIEPHEVAARLRKWLEEKSWEVIEKHVC